MFREHWSEMFNQILLYFMHFFSLSLSFIYISIQYLTLIKVATNKLKSFEKIKKINLQSTYFFWISLSENRLSLTHLCSVLTLNLTYFNPMFHFYTSWKRLTTSGFLTLSGCIEMEHWPEIGYSGLNEKLV